MCHPKHQLADGHLWPETYFLGSLQSREVLYKVITIQIVESSAYMRSHYRSQNLEEYVRDGELTENQAINIVKDALFHNSNRLYNLGLQSNFTET